jgi:site-specific recombinase XerD
MNESTMIPFAPDGESARSIFPDDMIVFGQAYARPQDNPARMYLLDLAEGSRPAMTAALNTIANALLPGATLDDIAWHTLTLQHTAAIRSWLMTAHQVWDKKTEEYRPFKPAHANKILSALRRTLDKAFDLGLMDTDHYQRAIRVKNLKGEDKKNRTGRMLKMKEAVALFAACNDGKPIGARDAAMLAVAYGAGLRRFEIAGLSLADYDPRNAKLTVQRGKGNKERIVSLPNGTVDAINRWLVLRGSLTGPLFPHILKRGTITNDYISPQAIEQAIKKRAELAGLSGADMFKTHDLRRTYISNLLDSSGDLAAIQALAGHANINTTAGYDRRGIRAQEAAAQTIHVPYQRPSTS